MQIKFYRREKMKIVTKFKKKKRYELNETWFQFSINYKLILISTLFIFKMESRNCCYDQFQREKVLNCVIFLVNWGQTFQFTLMVAHFYQRKGLFFFNTPYTRNLLVLSMKISLITHHLFCHHPNLDFILVRSSVFFVCVSFKKIPFLVDTFFVVVFSRWITYVKIPRSFCYYGCKPTRKSALIRC